MRYLKVALTVILLLLLTFFQTVSSVSTSSGDSWKIDTVENGLDMAVPISIALDDNSDPHAVYCNESHFDIKYVYYNGTKWNIEVLPHQGGLYPSLALDNNGNPHIAYEGSNTICYASLDGKNWDIMDVDPMHNSDSMFPSLALDSSGNSYMSYVLLSSGSSGPNPSSIEYATLKENNWSIETIDEAGVAYSTSIALDSKNLPHIVYMISDYSTDYLKYAWFDGKNWHKETVDSAPHPSLEFDSMVLDAEAHPHICYENREYNADYTNITKADLKYAWFDGVKWHKERIGSGVSASLDVDSKDRARIAYSDLGKGSLEYTWFDGRGWKNEQVYSKSFVGTISMVLDKKDSAHIFFIDSNHSLKYAVEEGQPSSESALESSQSILIVFSLVSVVIGAAIAISVWYWKKVGKHKSSYSGEVNPKNENK